MNIQEITEGRVKDLAYSKEWDRQNSPGAAPTVPKPQMTASITINGKHWKDFPTEQEAMRIANSVYHKNPRLRVSVVPK
jgi:hypothetical protein